MVQVYTVHCRVLMHNKPSVTKLTFSKQHWKHYQVKANLEYLSMKYTTPNQPLTTNRKSTSQLLHEPSMVGTRWSLRPNPPRQTWPMLPKKEARWQQDQNRRRWLMSDKHIHIICNNIYMLKVNKSRYIVYQCVSYFIGSCNGFEGKELLDLSTSTSGWLMIIHDDSPSWNKTWISGWLDDYISSGYQNSYWKLP